MSRPEFNIPFRHPSSQSQSSSHTHKEAHGTVTDQPDRPHSTVYPARYDNMGGVPPWYKGLHARPSIPTAQSSISSQSSQHFHPNSSQFADSARKKAKKSLLGKLNPLAKHRGWDRRDSSVDPRDPQSSISLSHDRNSRNNSVSSQGQNLSDAFPSRPPSIIGPINHRMKDADEFSLFPLDADVTDMDGIVKSGPKSNSELPTLATWTAPESWNVTDTNKAGEDDSPVEEVGEIVDATEDHDQYDDTDIEYSKWVIQKYGDIREGRWAIRVFREDGTFTTLSLGYNSKVTEILATLQKKFFLHSVANYQIAFTVGGTTKTLELADEPLKIQTHFLQLQGYEEADHLNIIGRDDLSYICRFVFRPSALHTISDDAEKHISKSFVIVDLKHLDLQTIPIVLYQHTYEIESLDLSYNPSIIIPLDFIQSCNNLQTIKWRSNRSSKFPLNILQTPKLTTLDLERNFLKQLPENINTLNNLKTLVLKCNQLSSLPKQFSKLKNLTYLNLSSNHFKNFPEEVTNIISLEELDISYNSISVIHESIGNLINLKKLNIATNRLSKASFPPSIKKLINLSYLDTRYNKISSMNMLGHLPNLEHLLCSKNKVSSFIDEMESLTYFAFDRNPITNLIFETMLPNLRVLNLSKAKLIALPVDFFNKVKNVEELRLDKNDFLTFPKEIGQLSKLVFLSCFGNNLSSLPEEISELSSLQYLDLHMNNLSSVPESIWNLRNLSVLNLSSNLLEEWPKFERRINEISFDGGRRTSERTNSSTLSPTESRRSSLSRRFSTANNPHFQPPVVAKSISTNGSTSSNNGGFQYGGFNSFGYNSQIYAPPLASCLLVLNLADNRLTDDIFDDIIYLTDLKTLNLSYNEITDIQSISHLKQLTNLYLSGNKLTSLPNDDLEHIQTLRILHLNGNKLKALPSELSKLPQLCVLDVGSNQLKYNVLNYTFDWNWNFNKELKYLNFSGNKRLEIKQLHYSPSANNNNPRDSGFRDLSGFTTLKQLRILGLMDVTLTTSSIPEDSTNCRVRTTVTDASGMSFGISDTLGTRDTLFTRDLILQKYRGNDEEVLAMVIEAKSKVDESQSSSMEHKISKAAQDIFAAVLAEELGKLDTAKGETPNDALRRAFLVTNKEIGVSTMSQESDGTNNSSSNAVDKVQGNLNLNSMDVNTGCVATVVYIQGKKIYVANVGDAQALLCKGNGEHVVLTTRHDPTTRSEHERIRASGGFVASTGTLDGVLDVSRAIGFYNLIPHILAAPSITELEITVTDEMLVIASNQVWEYVPYQTAYDVLRSAKEDSNMAAQKLRDFAISYGCSDKIIVIVISLNKKKQQQQQLMAQIQQLQSRNNKSIAGSVSNSSDGDFQFKKKSRDKNSLPVDSNLARLGGEIEPPVGLVALVFTDIKNSTLMWDSFPDAMRSAIKTHNSIMRRQLRIMNGYEVKTEGDAFMVSFSTPTAALSWCFSIQSQLLNADWPTEIIESDKGCAISDENGQLIYRGLSVRMGIHWGTPVCEPDPITSRMDYFGPMVNRASRVSSIADGGQIALSSDFLSEVNKLEKSYDIVTAGQASIEEAYGHFLPSHLIHGDMSSLKSTGWEIIEIGEMKLKGLETPEFVSLIYPKSLSTRAKFVGDNNKPQSESLLSQEWLTNLQIVVVRLEQICSILNGSQSKISKTDDLRKDPPDLKNKSESDYLLYLERYVTRIENALCVLSVRSAIGKGNIIANHARGNGDIDGNYIELQQILQMLQQMSIPIKGINIGL